MSPNAKWSSLEKPNTKLAQRALLDFKISLHPPSPDTHTTTTTTTTTILHVACWHEFWIVSTWNRCCKTNGSDNGVICCDRWSTLLLWAVCFGKCICHHLTPMGPDTWNLPVLPSSLKKKEKKSATFLDTFTGFMRHCEQLTKANRHRSVQNCLVDGWKWDGPRDGWSG